MPLLSNCGPHSAAIGPGLTLVNSGSILQASVSYAGSLQMNKLKNDITNIYSSPSKRTKSTCNYVFNKNLTINYEKELYSFNFQDILNWLKKSKGDKNTILIVGHNPALIDLIQYLSRKEEIILIPTCSLCEIHLNIDTWNDIKKNCGEIHLMQKVKSLKNYNYKK